MPPIFDLGGIKNKENFVDYRMKWIVLPYSESYFEETKYILVKFYQFFSSLFYMPTFLQNLRLMRPLSFIRRRPYFVQCSLYLLVHRQYPGNVCSARLCFNHIVLQQNCLQTQQLLFLYCIQYCVKFLESTPGIETQRKWLFA